jgi:hypothetical protein
MSASLHQLQQRGLGLRYRAHGVQQLASAMVGHQLVTEPTREGWDVSLACHVHGREGLPVSGELGLVPGPCPECEAQLDGAADRARYALRFGLVEGVAHVR